MMQLRYAAIALLKWFANFFAITLLLRFVIPEGWSGYLLISLPIWILSFFLALFFAEWALHKQLPGTKELAWMLVIWMVVSLTLQILEGIFLLGSIYYVINSPDMYVQYLLEIIAIFLAARMVRKKRMSSALSEGLSG